MHYTTPKISPANPTQKDMGKDWTVWFRIYDGNRWIQKSYKKGINNYKKFRDRLAEANALVKEASAMLADGWDPLQINLVKEIRPKTLKEAIDFILRLKNVTLRKKSQSTYKYICDLLTGKHGNTLLEKFTSSTAQSYMDDLLLSKNYSGRTYNDHLTVLSTIFNVIVKRKWITENPFHSIARMKTTIGRNLAFTEDEKESLRKLLYKKDRWVYYFSQIMYYTFIRRTELARVRISDIDLINKTIIIRDPKNGIQESVVIPVGLEPILKEMKVEHFPDHLFLFGRHLYPSENIYVNVDHISARHNKFCRQLGFDKLKGLYSWKATGTIAAYYATGKDIYSLMRQLRHKSLDTTQIYLKTLGLIQNDVFRISMIA